MIDASSKTARYLATGGVVAAAGTTTVMNVKFGMSLGSDDIEKMCYAVLGIAFDIIKIFGLAFIVHAWSKGRRFKAFAAVLVWSVTVIYSLVAATGFAAMTRTHVVAERSHHAEQARIASETYARLAAEFETMKKNKRYTTTSGCTVPKDKMTEDSRNFCDLPETGYWAKYNALDDARKALPGGVVHEADPQMAFFAGFLGVSKKVLIEWWALGLAIILEIVASIGTFAFSSSRKAVSKSDASVVVQNKTEAVSEAPRKRGRPKGSKNRPKLVVVN